MAQIIAAALVLILGILGYVVIWPETSLPTIVTGLGPLVLIVVGGIWLLYAVIRRATRKPA